MINKIIELLLKRLSVKKAETFYKVFRIGFIFNNGQPKMFIEI